MSLIEQAAQRLEQLRKAGVDVPSQTAESGSGKSGDTATPVSAPVAPGKPVRQSKQEEPISTHSPEMAISRRVELNLEALSAAGIIRPDAPRSQLADEYRGIKRPLILNAMGRGAAPIREGNLIMRCRARARLSLQPTSP